jgi:hypothetical protein
MISFVSYGQHLFRFDSRSDPLARIVFSHPKMGISSIGSICGSTLQDCNMFLLNVEDRALLMDHRYLKSCVSYKPTPAAVTMMRAVKYDALAAGEDCARLSCLCVVYSLITPLDLVLMGYREASQILFNTFEASTTADRARNGSLALATGPFGSSSVTERIRKSAYDLFYLN